MTAETYNRLEPYAETLRQIKENHYARIASGDVDTLAEIYKDHYGVALTKSERNCSHCIFRAVGRLAEDFFQYVKPEPAKKTTKSKKNSNQSDNQ